MNSLISWICSAVVYGTVIMFGALGEILTEKSVKPLALAMGSVNQQSQKKQ